MRYFAVLFIVLLIISCAKKEDNIPNDTTLPNFGGVNLGQVFQGRKPLQNRQQVISILAQYYQNTWSGSDMSGGILVANGDDVLLEKYKGFGRENNQMPIDDSTPLHIASISKPITAMAILKLVEAQHLKLDQAVSSVLPDFPYKKITVLDLLSHRSGLPKYEYFLEKYHSDKNYFSNQDILSFLVQNQPNLEKEPNTGFMYSNTNYAILALIIEKVTEISYPQAVEEMIFKPLQMKNSFVFQEKDISTASQSFYSKNNKLYPLNKLDLIYGDKNIYTTPRDLLNFSKAMFSPDFLPEYLMEKAFASYSNEKAGINNYGLGFRIKNFGNGKKLIYHNGWWHGSNTVFVHLRDSQTTIVAIGNKYSRKIYSAVMLSGLFEDFPYPLDEIVSSKSPYLVGGK